MASNTSKNTRAPDSSALLHVSLQLLAVGLFTIIAGTNDEMGTLVILFMVGMWLMYLIQNSAVVGGLEKMMEAVN